MHFILDNVIGTLLTKDMWDVIRSGSLHCTPSRAIARHRRDAQATQGHTNESMNTSKGLRHEGRASDQLLPQKQSCTAGAAS